MKSPEIEIALQGKDITELNKRFDGLEKKVDSGFNKADSGFLRIEKHLEDYAKTYLAKEEYRRDQKMLVLWQERMEKDLGNKVPMDQFLPVKSILTKINWLIISIVIVAVVAVVIVKQPFL